MDKEKDSRTTTLNLQIGTCKGKCFRLINLDSAKLVALLLVLVAVFYNVQHRDVDGVASSCSILLTDGKWRGEQEWQPTGCMLHMYTSSDAKHCLRYVSFTEKPVHFVYSGDSRVREQYLAFIHHLDPKENASVFSGKSINRTYIDARNRFRVDFFWSAFSHEPCLFNLQKWKNEGHQPTLIIAGNGLWNAKSDTEYTLRGYSQSLNVLAEKLKLLLKNDTRILWKLQEAVYTNPRLLVNKRLRSYNKAAIKIFNNSAVQIWSSSRLIFLSRTHESVDKVHLGPVALKYDLQIVLNLFCNEHMHFIDGTCCSKNERPITLTQVVTFSMLGLSALIASAMGLHKLVAQLSTGRSSIGHIPLNDLSKRAPTRDPCTLVTSLARLGLIMAYFYLCDRSDVFHRENKHFSEKSFYLPIVCLLAVALCFNKASAYSQVLHADQTDEWKDRVLRGTPQHRQSAPRPLLAPARLAGPRLAGAVRRALPRVAGGRLSRHPGRRAGIPRRQRDCHDLRVRLSCRRDAPGDSRHSTPRGARRRETSAEKLPRVHRGTRAGQALRLRGLLAGPGVTSLE